ncbi:MAG: response regulator transcription factor [Candidatus Gracilibacteria bacterium]|nr:response regulator transcription factor [Candidatus Gracilibacteria bacterium]
MPTKILLIEDNKDIRDNIKEYLELEGFSIETASDGEEGMDKALLKKYDLILLDLMLPKIDGITIAKKLTRKSETPIIMITAKDSINEKLVGFESGAVDYIVKPFDLRELEARIKANLKTNNNNLLISYNDLEIDLQKREFKKGGKIVKITIKEFLIFEFLYNNKDKLLTRSDIIEHVWGGDSLFDDDAKLDVYISTLRKKLDKNIIETVKGVGYKFGN